MGTKHKPDTPLPWSAAVSFDGRPIEDPLEYESPGFYDNKGIYSESSDKYPVGCSEYNVFQAPEDYVYIIHAANAYPRLVEALKNTPQTSAAHDLLRELGETE